MDDYPKTLSGFFKVFYKLFFIPIVFTYFLLIIATVDNMIISAGIFNAQGPCHRFVLAGLLK
jgi:hypothetical protein